MSLLPLPMAAFLAAHDRLLIVTYLLVFVALACYGFHRSSLVYLYYRHRSKRPEPLGRLQELPKVTIQLPLFNEMYVARKRKPRNDGDSLGGQTGQDMAIGRGGTLRGALHAADAA